MSKRHDDWVVLRRSPGSRCCCLRGNNNGAAEIPTRDGGIQPTAATKQYQRSAHRLLFEYYIRGRVTFAFLAGCNITSLILTTAMSISLVRSRHFSTLQVILLCLLFESRSSKAEGAIDGGSGRSHRPTLLTFLIMLDSTIIIPIILVAFIYVARRVRYVRVLNVESVAIGYIQPNELFFDLGSYRPIQSRRFTLGALECL